MTYHSKGCFIWVRCNHADEAPIWFDDDPARNQMAILTRLDDGRMRIEFPAPLFESEFDILEFAP